MAATLDLSPDELLSTTRSVRKRLDLERPVEPELIRECVDLATQAPTGGNAQGWHFIVVTDADKRAKLAELYRTGWEMFYGDPESADREHAAGRLDLPRHPASCAQLGGLPHPAPRRGAGARDPVHRRSSRQRAGDGAGVDVGIAASRPCGTSVSRREHAAWARASRRST